MTYTIKENEQFKSNEVYFDCIPTKTIRDSLKALKMRWNAVKKCWYGFVSEDELTKILKGGEEFKTGVIASDGYLGATEYTGVNNNKFDYSSDCFKKAFKACGLNGITVKKHSYSGGMSFVFTVKLNKDDYISFDDFLKSFDVSDYYIYSRLDYYTTSLNNYGDRYIASITLKDYQNLEDCIKKEIIRGAAELQYKRYLKGYSIYRADDNKKILTDKGYKRLSYIHSVILSFHHDDSNSMVDYFDTNFYYDINYKLPEV